MPIYEYECSSCRKRFEKLQKLSDPLLSECPACGGGLHKAFSVPAIQFKGSGWYKTDYARKSTGGSASSDSSESKGSAKKPDPAGGGSKSV